MEHLFREMSQKIKIYLAIESVEDPIEKNTSTVLLPPIPISAIVNDLGFGKIKWQMDGISTSDAKEIYIEKRNKSLLEQSQKIEISGVDYEGYKILGKMQIKTEGDYCRIYIYRKEA